MSKAKKIPRKKKKKASKQHRITRVNEEKKEMPFGACSPEISYVVVPEADKGTSPKAAESLVAVDGTQNKHKAWLHVLAALFIFLVAFAVYSNTLNVPFVFDDRTNITDNPAIRITSLTIESMRSAAFESPVPSRPLANISLALNYYFHEYELFGYHLVNITIHALTGMLLYFFFLLTLKSPALKRVSAMPAAIAFAAALLWLTHPLQTQSVTYVIQRMNSMATMFYVLSMLLYGIARISQSMRLKILLIAMCTVSGLAGFYSKEIAVTLPIFILLYEFYFFQDLDMGWIRSRAFICSALLVMIIGGYLAFQKLGSINAIALGYSNRQFDLEQRLLTEPRVVAFYISQIFFPIPARLNLFHDFPLSLSFFQPLTTFFSFTALVLSLIFAAAVARRWRLLSFSILWFLGNQVLESSIIPLEIVFEHRNYLPSIIFCLLISYLVFQLSRPIRLNALAPVVTILIVMTFSYWTYQRNGDWRDEETLLIDCLEKAPNIARTQASLGYVLMWQWRLDEAARRFHMAMKLNPTRDIRSRIQTNMEFIQKMKQYPDYHKKKQ